MEVIIRRAEKLDVPGIKAIYEQPHAYAGTLQLPLPSEEMWQSRFDNPPAGYHNLVAEFSGKVIGQLGLMTSVHPRRKHAAEIGMAVCSSALNQGVGTKLLSAALDMCDNWLNIQRVELQVYTDNEPAISLYKKSGFEVEGEHKMFAFRDGRYADVLTMVRFNSVI